MCSAIMTVRCRTSVREPGKFTWRSITPLGPATHKCTRPTGFSALPPPGPAIPVMPTPMSAPQPGPGPLGQRAGDLGADRADPLDQLGRHTGQIMFGLVGIDHQSAQHVGRRAGQIGQPAGEQAGRARLGGRDGQFPGEQRVGDDLVDRAPVEREDRRRVGRRDHRLEAVVVGLARGAVPGDDLELALAQAGRDLEAGQERRRCGAASRPVRTRRVPHSRIVLCRSSARPANAARTVGSASAAGHIACSSRGGPGSTTTGGPLRPSATGTTRPGAVPIGASTVAPSGTSACLRLPAAVATGSTDQPRPALSRSTIAAICCSSSGSRCIAGPARPRRPRRSDRRRSARGRPR